MVRPDILREIQGGQISSKNKSKKNKPQINNNNKNSIPHKPCYAAGGGGIRKAQPPPKNTHTQINEKQRTQDVHKEKCSQGKNLYRNSYDDRKHKTSRCSCSLHT